MARKPKTMFDAMLDGFIARGLFSRRHVMFAWEEPLTPNVHPDRAGEFARLALTVTAA